MKLTLKTINNEILRCDNLKVFQRIYSQVTILRMNVNFDWTEEDLIQLKSIYDVISNMSYDESIEKMKKLCLVELSFLDTKIRSILFYQEDLDIDKSSVNVLFSKGYHSMTVYSLAQILTLQLYHHPEFIQIKMLNKLNSLFSSMSSFSDKEFRYLIKLLFSLRKNVGRIDDLRITPYLHMLEKDLNCIVFRHQTEILLKSVGSYQDFIHYLSGIEKLTLFRLKEAEILDKVIIFLQNSKIEDLEKRELFHRIEYIQDNIYSSLSADEKVALAIKNGKILLSNQFPNYSFHYRKPNWASDDIILTIDEAKSLDLDGAFQVKEENDIYVLDLYVTDVPNFLMENEMLCREAYQRGNSMYLHFPNEQLVINMLPEFLANDLLSLHQNTIRSVIDFTFFIGKNGCIYDTKICCTDIRISKNITPNEALKIIQNPVDNFSYSKALKLYDKVCRVMMKNVNETNCLALKDLGCSGSNYLVALPTILINSFVATQSRMAIYLECGQYTKISSEAPYVHSVAPLRRFCDDINLAFFLEQMNVGHFDETKLYFVEQHLDEIIEHLNYRNKISKFVSAHSNFVKKYIRK